jgi:nanoRNase/pAp phosphatase (c-di-AMP/oligoRNAs hydrolase)
MAEDRLQRLLSAVEGAKSVLILPHNDPDPDAIASAVALRHLLAETVGLKSHIAYRGIVGRAENKALVRYLGRPLRRLAAEDLRAASHVALVDTQPGAGNNALPPGLVPVIVLDHHPWREQSAAAPFADVRSEVGATATLLTGYLRAAAIELPPWLATALFYGIKSDTLGLARAASPADVDAYLYLQSRADIEALAEIERAQVPVEYFRRLDAALHTARIFDGVVLSYVGPMQRPDLAAEMADLFLRLKGSQWVICTGAYKGELVLAVRTRNRRGGAGQLVQAIVGDGGLAGGHGMMAAGHVPLRGADAGELAQLMGRRALEHLGVAGAAGRPLMD